jgi:sugar O-acyltransferase (sialic acid O-acetyltransferase NeuD family)
VSLQPILLVGAGGHARACIDVVEQEGRFRIGGLIGSDAEVGLDVLGYPVLGTDRELQKLAQQVGRAIVAVGQIKSAATRIRLFEALEASACDLPVIVSPRAYLSRHASVGAGSIVMHGAIVNAGVRIGRNCIINSQSLVEHDTTIQDHCHVATAAAINSGVQIGRGTFVGSQSSVRQGTIIGQECVIGMGQRVLADCPPGSQVPPRTRS